VIGVALDIALYTKTVAEGGEHFWRVAPFNWVWLALWSMSQVAALLGLFNGGVRSDKNDEE
jgi:hypothetical protein